MRWKAQSRGEADGEWGKLKVDARKGGRIDMAVIQSSDTHYYKLQRNCCTLFTHSLLLSNVNLANTQSVIKDIF